MSDEELSAAPSAFARVSGAVAGALVAALLASVPAALRLPREAAGVGTAWLSLAGAALVPLALAIPVLRSAREGARGLFRDRPAIGAATLAAWAAAVFVALAALGAVLRAKTHHHALAGATFALAALVLGLGLGAFAMRASVVARALAAAGRGRLVAAGFALVGVALLAVAVRVGGLPGALAPADREWLVDGLALALGAAFGAGTRLERSRAAALGVPLAVLLFAAGLVGYGPSIGEAAREHAPAFGLLFRVVLRR